MQTCSVTCTGTTGNSMTSRGALDPAASQVRPAIGTVLHHVLHPMGRCHTPAGKAVASLLSGLLLRWRLAARTGLEAGPFGAGRPASPGLPVRQSAAPTAQSPAAVPERWACSWAMMAMRKSRSAVIRSLSVSTSLLYDITTATRASVWQPGLRPIHLTKSEQLPSSHIPGRNTTAQQERMSGESSAPERRKRVKSMTTPRENFRLTPEQEQELKALAELPDDQIDFSDIPLTTDWSNARRGVFYEAMLHQGVRPPEPPGARLTDTTEGGLEARIVRLLADGPGDDSNAGEIKRAARCVLH